MTFASNNRFVPAEHPRASDGKFSEKLGTAPNFTLDEPLVETAADDFVPGQYVTYTVSGRDGAAVVLHGEILQAYRYTENEPMAYTLVLDDGNTWSGVYGSDIREDTTRDSAENIARHARFNAAYGISQHIAQGKASRSERMHLTDIESGINEDMNMVWRLQAAEAFMEFEHSDDTAQTPEARLRELLDDSFDGQALALARVGETDDERYEQDIARRTALALFYRDRIDDSSGGWTQDHYDHVTRAWREAIGPIHPDDEVRPASWDRTQHTAMSPSRKFESFSDNELEGLRTNAWREYREAPDGLKLRAARVIDAAADSRGLQ